MHEAPTIIKPKLRMVIGGDESGIHKNVSSQACAGIQPGMLAPMTWRTTGTGTAAHLAAALKTIAELERTLALVRLELAQVVAVVVSEYYKTCKALMPA